MCTCVCVSVRGVERGGHHWNTFTLSGSNFHTLKQRKADGAATCTLPLITLLTSPLDPEATGPLPQKQEVTASQPAFQMDVLCSSKARKPVPTHAAITPDMSLIIVTANFSRCQLVAAEGRKEK